MKVITNEFKEEIAKLGREIDFKINLHINDKIITEDNKFLMTQSNLHLIVEQLNEEEIDETISGEDIYNVSVVNKGKLLSTMMKEFDFEITQDLRIGDIVDCSFGLKVGDEYEYINYGRYIIFSKEHNEDTNTYSYVSFDSMLLSMIEVDDVSIIQGVTVQQAIENICEKVGLSVNITAEDIENLPNLENVINEEAFNDIEMTYRDVLDMICQCLGVSMISDGKVLYLKPLNRSVVDTIDEFYLKDVNVKFGDKYMVNSVVLSRSEDTDTIYRRDEESVEKYGVHEFKIKDNLIMLYDDREDYIDEIFDQLNGLEFYINDFSSTGITYLDWLDFYNINVGDNTYKCLMLNDEIKIQQGLEETIYTEMPEETTTDYKTSGKTDKEVSFIVDKQNGKISAKVSKGDVINEINLDESGASINADKISLEGKTISLTSDNINIDSTNFKVDEDGNITATGGTIGGYSLNANEFYTTIYAPYDFTQTDLTKIRNYLMGTGTLTPEELIKYDINNDGEIDARDYLGVFQYVRNNITTTNPGTIKINSQNIFRIFELVNGNNDTIFQLGLQGVSTQNISANNIQSGQAIITPVANTPTYIDVTFETPFGGEPNVIATPSTTVPYSEVRGIGVTNVTTTGFRLYIYRTNTNVTGIYWIAMN